MSQKDNESLIKQINGKIIKIKDGEELTRLPQPKLDELFRELKDVYDKPKPKEIED